VDDLAESLEAQTADVVAGQILDFVVGFEHHDLREDGYGLELDAERPHDFKHPVRLRLLVQQQRQPRAGQQQLLPVREVVHLALLGQFVRHCIPNHVYQRDGYRNLGNLHEFVLERHELKE